MMKYISKLLPALLFILSCLLVFPNTANAQGCTPAEVQRIISFSNHMMNLIQSGNFQELLNQSVALSNSLSQNCQVALERAQQANPRGRRGGGYSPPQVYDHGGGQYSVPGVGACGPGGCISY